MSSYLFLCPFLLRYQLGPNGAIITSLNLFTTRFDQVSFNKVCFKSVD